jgi:hypothetical protein
MDFGTLKSRILNVIGRAPTDVCYELVTADINRDMRLRCMEATVTLVEAASVTLPSNFLQVIDIYRDTDPRIALQPTTTTGTNALHMTSGIPRTYAIVDGALLLNPAPSGSENLKLRYYAKLADLAADGDTNDVLTIYPDVYVYGVLAHHAALIGDEKGLAWESKYQVAFRRTRSSDAASRMGGAPLVPAVRVTP